MDKSDLTRLEQKIIEQARSKLSEDIKKITGELQDYFFSLGPDLDKYRKNLQPKIWNFEKEIISFFEEQVCINAIENFVIPENENIRVDIKSKRKEEVKFYGGGGGSGIVSSHNL